MKLLDAGFERNCKCHKAFSSSPFCLGGSVLVTQNEVTDWILMSSMNRYIPLPEASARKAIIMHLLTDTRHELSDDDVDDIVQRTDGTMRGSCSVLSVLTITATHFIL